MGVDTLTVTLFHIFRLRSLGMLLRFPMTGQGKRRCNRPNKSQFRRSTTPSKLQVKKDLVKSEKMKIFITENALPFIHMTISCFVMLTLIFHIRSLSLVMVSSPRFDPKSCQRNSTFSPAPVSYPKRIPISPSPSKVHHHQVFLNFRGKQLRYNFVSHLSDALKRHDIRFFIDKFEQRGKDLKHLFKRIEESNIALAIFSTRYPESRWCLDELVKMKNLADKGKLRVIPIFYKVNAGDVRKPRGDSKFGRAFWKLAEVSARDKVRKWRDALESISNKMGLTLGDKSSESDFLYEILTEIKRVREAIGLEEEEKPFWWKKIFKKVRDHSYYKLVG